MYGGNGSACACIAIGGRSSGAGRRRGGPRPPKRAIGPWRRSAVAPPARAIAAAAALLCAVSPVTLAFLSHEVARRMAIQPVRSKVAPERARGARIYCCTFEAPLSEARLFETTRCHLKRPKKIVGACRVDACQCVPNRVDSSLVETRSLSHSRAELLRRRIRRRSFAESKTSTLHS